VNTSDTRVELVLDLDAAGLPDPVDARLRARFGDRVRVVATDERSQHQNRRLALNRLVAQLAGALRRETPRRPTRPSPSSVEARLQAKRRVAQRKLQRRPVHGDE
jgi:ribosome-associated protein